jgi:hypothetical protein
MYLINSSGYPDGDESGAVAYDGIRLEGAKSFTSTVPDPRIVTHTGDDRAFAQDVLPPTEMETATLTTGKTNLSLDAALTGTKVEDLLGDVNMGVTSSDKQGAEPQVMVFGWRQALDTEKGSSTYGQRRYITRMYPSCRIIPKPASMEDGAADENSYSVVPTVVTKTPWGKALAEITNGATEGQSLRFISSNPLMMNKWNGNGTLSTFTLSNTPISATKTRVHANGTVATVSSVDTVAKTCTLSTPPANLSEVVAWYETSDTMN